MPLKTLRITNNTAQTVYPIMRDPNDGPYDPYDPFLKVNLTVTQALTPKVSALLTVENLTNNNTGEQFDYVPSLGRITTVGLRARW